MQDNTATQDTATQDTTAQGTTTAQPISNLTTHSLNTAHHTVLNKILLLEQLRKTIGDNEKKIKKVKKACLEKVKNGKLPKDNFKVLKHFVYKIKKNIKLERFVFEKALMEKFQNPRTNLLVFCSMEGNLGLAKRYYDLRHTVLLKLKEYKRTKNRVFAKEAEDNYKNFYNLSKHIERTARDFIKNNYKSLMCKVKNQKHQKRTFTFKDISNKRENLADVSQVTSPIINMSTPN